MKSVLFAIIAACVSACATVQPDPPLIAPGIYLAMKGTQQEMMDIHRMSKAMLVAGDFCARTNQKPDIIVGKDGEQSYMAFKCGEEGVWPPKHN